MRSPASPFSAVTRCRLCVFSVCVWDVCTHHYYGEASVWWVFRNTSLSKDSAICSKDNINTRPPFHPSSLSNKRVSAKIKYGFGLDLFLLLQAQVGRLYAWRSS